jgi:hypothetical protein
MRRILGLLEQCVSALEARLAPPHGNRKCPRCHHLSLEVIATGAHPDFAEEGIEQHEISCGRCGYRGQRLHDPTGYIC